VKPTFPLIAVSFFAADVQAGVGPFIGIYLLANGWTSEKIGTVLTIAGIVGMLVTAPAGALVDATTRRRSIVAAGGALTVLAAVIIWLGQGFWPVTLSQIATAVAGAAMGPALAGLTLGIVGRQNFDRQFGRNQVANHAGNIAAALLSGWLGAWLGIVYVFALSAAFGVGCVLTAFLIPARSVHRHHARGIARDDNDDNAPVQNRQREYPRAQSALAPAGHRACRVQPRQFGDAAALQSRGCIDTQSGRKPDHGGEYRDRAGRHVVGGGFREPSDAALRLLVDHSRHGF
jgi:MFS family permease